MATNPTITLIGFLGKDRIVRDTRERTYTKTVHNKVIDGEEEIKVYVPSRTYVKLSLATHERSGTRWHDLIVWTPVATSSSPARATKSRSPAAARSTN